MGQARHGEVLASGPARGVVGHGRFFVSFLPALVIALTFAAPPSAATAGEAAPTTVIIVDSSGSMAAREADGRVRLDAARATIVEALSGWPAETHLGIIAYGHRRTSDCTDIETLLAPGPVAIEAISARLAGLRARGKTPLSDSLRQAAAALPEAGGDILLVSDGLETCNADPCAVAAALNSGRANLTIHVVGFGVTPNERAQLQCIADNGGGQYFGAADATALAGALGEVSAVIAAAEPVELAPVPEPLPPPPPRAVSLYATAGALGRIVDAPVQWLVTAETGELAYSGESRALLLDLLPGRYIVQAAAANASGEALVTVRQDEAGQEFGIEVPAGRLDLALAAHAGAQPFGDLEAQGVAWTLEPLGGQAPAIIPPVARPSLLLAPGLYRVEARLQDLVAMGMEEIAAGQPVALQLDFQLGTLVLEAALSDEGSPLSDDRAFAWQVGVGNAATTIAQQSRPRLTLPAGRYPVRLTIGGHEMTTDAEIVAGAERIARVLVSSGELALSARLGPGADPLDDWRDTSWQVSAVTALGLAPGTPGTDGALLEAMPRLTLSPGIWRVQLESGLATVEQEVTVAPEATTSVTFDIGAARLTMTASPATGEPPTNIVYQIFALDAQGAPAAEPLFAAGSSEGAATIVPAGRWRVTALDEMNRSAAAEIDLAAGDDHRLELRLQ